MSTSLWIGFGIWALGILWLLWCVYTAPVIEGEDEDEAREEIR